MIGDLMDYEDPIASGQLNQSRLRFLGSNPENICYCDEVCIAFGDCCSDYTFVCPPSDCYVTNWSEWSACVLDDTAQKCGVGTRTRTREVRREANYGGAPCPDLVEQLSCFHECPPREEDVTTVALLLDYKYNDIREKLSRDNIYWDLPEVASKVEKLSYYCVEYEIGWVNRNCIDKKITSKLHEGNKICAECQPEA
ncbi:unnamed protein product, partial [Anisakis simplex]|uniref:SMB domain-containing protein n=1 Tax=Anisakis simplex TaxID=6269 RepID=A0A0M3J364_ANISI